MRAGDGAQGGSDTDETDTSEHSSHPRGPTTFDTELELFSFVMSCNNGKGLSFKDTARMFHIMGSSGLDLSKVRGWGSKRAVMQYGLKLLMGTRKYKETEVRLPGIRWTFKVIHTGGVKALDELFSNPANQPGFVLQPERILAPDGVLFSAAESPSLTDSENCPDRDISCIIRTTIFAHNAASSPPAARPFSSFGYNAKALPCAVRRRAAAKSAW